MQVGQCKSILDYCRKEPINEKFVDGLKEAASQTFSNAVDMFFKPDREVSEAKVAYSDLSDLQGGLKALLRRHDETRAENIAKAEAKNGWGRAIVAPNADTAGLKKMIADMNTLLPLYACVAMVPGPMSVTVKNTAKEMLEFTHNASANSQYSQSSQSSDASRREAVGLAFSLVGAGAYHSVEAAASEASARAQGSSSSSQSTNFRQERLTADERVMPQLHDLASRVSEMSFVGGNQLAMVKNESGKLEQRTAQADCDGPHLWVPESGADTYSKQPFFWDNHDYKYN